MAVSKHNMQSKPFCTSAALEGPESSILFKRGKNECEVCVRSRTRGPSGEGGVWEVNFSPRLSKVKVISSGGGVCFPSSSSPGQAESWYLKDGGQAFIQVIVVTWLLVKDVS